MCVGFVQIMGWTQELLVKSQTTHGNKFIGAVLQKGGAEGWVQVELKERFDTLPNYPSVQREEHIYENPLAKVDFLIGCRFGGQYMCVELKVESLYHSSDLGRVTMAHKQWTEVADDLAQLQKRKAEFIGHPACAVAIVWSQEATAGLDHWLGSQPGVSPMKDTIRIDHQGELYDVSVYVIPA